ncbi:MAG TPA: bifunctional hydroxymethylpyrimidine kinase/phosphomethylpyrimidine kinase [Blastocatellia bacterium]|jgi:hydroxymethylpyrimidine kinase/phosphomethylpyrimidine kinase|nr:bifunctional hydroxymethylpyrimidine kinase/phosphomethylpyrimidine kinase [Blastocatellia bacterium]
MSIAGFDPSGGAGALADIKTFAAMGCFGTAAVTSLTFQNTVAVYGASHQTAEALRAQIEPVIDDFKIAAVKIGMTPTRELIEVVAEIIEKKRLPNVVVDTVIRSTSGYDLMDAEAIGFLIERLLPLADVITPNMAEAERLTGSEVKDLEGMKRAAERIHEMSGAPKSRRTSRRAALVKGGHLKDEATDILFDGREFHIFKAQKIETRDAHGTGCSLSSAIAALLAQGCEIPEAVARAKQYLSEILRSAPDIGHGARPLNHFPMIRQMSGRSGVGNGE